MEDLLQAASTCIASLSLSAVITAASAAILVVFLVIICLQGRQKRVLSRVRKRFVAPLATERVKDAFESLRRRELEWLRNLPHPDQLLIETGAADVLEARYTWICIYEATPGIVGV
jgi:deoxyadenosine/deoxycytidine kinase